MEGPQPSAPRDFVKLLHQAVETGDLMQIQALLDSLEAEKRGSLLSSEEESLGQLPFHGAARNGDIEVLELLLPQTLQHLIDTPTKQGRWSCVHLAAAYGHAKIVQWLCEVRMADLNLQDEDGNTAMHLAVVLGHKDVVRLLVTAGANLFSLNRLGMMPFSLCKDSTMFEALFSRYTAGFTSFNRARPLVQSSWPLDAENRSFLHYAAQFARDSDGITKLISELQPEQLQRRDNRGDTFLHVAAKYGNMQVLQALRKVDLVSIDICQLVSDNGSDPIILNPGLCALLNNQQEFFDELLTICNVKITLRCIIQGLMAEFIDKPAELINNPDIKHRLALFASTLPTYLALYAKKECIFNFLLETKLISVNQWDDEFKRTCLHWAVLDNRVDIVDQLIRNAETRPGIPDTDGKTPLQHAFEGKNHMIMDSLLSKRRFKEYEEKMNRDREIYVQALNAILVGAALIASVTFAGWLQLPSDNFNTLAMKIFWASNCVSFFTAVATMCITTSALVPTPSKYVGDIVKQLRLAIVMDAGLLALSLAAVMWAFAAAGFAALHVVHTHTSSYQGIMRITTAVGGLLSFVVWIAFIAQLYRSAPPRSVLISLLVPSVPPGSFLDRCWPASFKRLRSRIGDSARYGYKPKLRNQLRAQMDDDLVVYRLGREPPPGTHEPPSSSIIPLQTMQQVLDELDMPEIGSSFLQNTYKQKEDENAYAQKKEKLNTHIMHHFNISKNVA